MVRTSLLAAALCGLAATPSARASLVWLEIGAPQTASVYCGLLLPSGEQWLGGDFWNVYRRTPPAVAWQLQDRQDLNDIFALARDGAGRIYAGGGSAAVYASTDDGASWSYNYLPSAVYYLPVLAVGTTASGAVLAMDSDGTIFRSTDHAHTWSQVSTGVGLSGRMDFATSTTGTLFAVNNGVLFSSTNDGVTWQLASNLRHYDQVEPIADGDMLLGANDGLFRRATSQSLTQLAVGTISGPVTALFQASDGHWLVASAAGIFRGDSNLTTWTLTGPALGEITGFLDQPGGGALAFGPHGVLRSDTQFEQWQSDLAGIHSPPLADLGSDGDALLMSTYYGEVFRSADAGATWSRRDGGLPNHTGTLARLTNGRLFVDAYSAASPVYSSADGGFNWAPLAGLPGFRAMVSTSTTNALALQSSVGLWRSANGGSTWSRASLFFDVESPSQLLLSQDGAVWVATGSNFYRSTDGGASWLAARSGLPADTSAQVWALSDGRMLTFGADRAYVFPSGGASWMPFGDTYTHRPFQAVDQSGTLLLLSSAGIVGGSMATGHWQVLDAGYPGQTDFVRSTSGNWFASTYHGPLQRLSDDRIFAATQESP